MSEHCYIACDLGAESGRVILGRLAAGRLRLEEIHRFANPPVRIAGSLRWDLLRIFEELKVGLRMVACEPVESLSVDSWGVDYALIGAGQPLLAVPHHYRDGRTDATFAATRADANLIFAETGIQFMPINTLYQLLADQRSSPQLLAVAEQFLNIADYFNFLFSGRVAAEESLASTSQLYDPRSGEWSARLIEHFGLPMRIFPPVVRSGSLLGGMRPELEEELGLRGVEVIATCSHDTGAAVAAVPAEGEGWAFLSSGTWSLLGVELPGPLINASVQAANFTNEAGYGGSTLFLKNLSGLWLLQECRRFWGGEGKALDYAELSRQAAEAEPLRSLINPNAERFLQPGLMPAKIAEYCRETGQPEPESPGQFARCIYESLALLYRRTLGEIAQLTGRRIERLHTVGGGSQSAFLNQCAADATGLQVLAGPVEATAVGNLLIQALSHRHLASLEELRACVRRSFVPEEFQPGASADWDLAYARFLKLESSPTNT